MHEVVPGLWVGNQASAIDSFPGVIISVVSTEEHLESSEPTRSFHIPLLDEDETGNLYPTTREILDEIADTIETSLVRSKCLVHCAMGVERSPLAVTWYLFRKRGMDFDEAYDLVKQKRPIAQDRRAWLNREARALALPAIAYVDDA